MPKSSKEGKDAIVGWMSTNQHIKKIVDIGAGSGTYRRLAKKNNLFPDSQWTAIEVWQPYIEDFNLRSMYDSVINENVLNIDFAALGAFDLAIMGDVLEHVTKEDAVTLVDRVLETSKIVIISIPIVHYPQGATHGNPHETHVKDDWSDEEVTETFKKYIQKSVIGSTIGVYWLSKDV